LGKFESPVEDAVPIQKVSPYLFVYMAGHSGYKSLVKQNCAEYCN